jgi:hypothetical protein
LTVALIVSALVVPAAGVAPASPAGYALTGTTTFVGTETRSLQVEFPEPVDAGDVDFEVRGGGRAYGFVMRKAGDHTPRREGLRPSVWATGIDHCNTRGCQAPPGFLVPLPMNVGETYSGTWDLYLVADGHPVEVTLQIDGEPGERTVDVDATGVPVDHRIRTLTPRVRESATGTIFSAGDFSTLRSIDYGMVGVWVKGAPHAATALGTCVYPDRRRNHPKVPPFLPGCLDHEGPSSTSFARGGLGRGRAQTLITLSGEGDRGLGGWFTTAAAVRSYGAVGLWIDFPGTGREAS